MSVCPRDWSSSAQGERKGHPPGYCADQSLDINCFRGAAPLAAAASALGPVHRLAPPGMRRRPTSLRACEFSRVAGHVPADAPLLFSYASSDLPPAKRHDAVRPCTSPVKIARVRFAPFVQEPSTPVANAAATHASSSSTARPCHAAVHGSAQGAVEFSSSRAASGEASRRAAGVPVWGAFGTR